MNVIGLALILLGFINIQLRWVIDKKYKVENLNEKFNKEIDQDKFCIFEGTLNILEGLGFVLVYIFFRESDIVFILYIICIIIYILVYQIFRKLIFE